MTRVRRILKPGGKYIQITFGQPHFRKRVLVKPEYNWELQTRTVGKFMLYMSCHTGRRP
jgi:ubiquinone/menaquinone biosynthesis C-methylase UbiE